MVSRKDKLRPKGSSGCQVFSTSKGPKDTSKLGATSKYIPSKSIVTTSNS